MYRQLGRLKMTVTTMGSFHPGPGFMQTLVALDTVGARLDAWKGETAPAPTGENSVTA